MIVLTQLLIIASVIGALHSMPWFRRASRNLDEGVRSAIRRSVRAAEDAGYPPETVPFLMLLAALTWICALAAKAPFVH